MNSHQHDEQHSPKPEKHQPSQEKDEREQRERDIIRQIQLNVDRELAVSERILFRTSELTNALKQVVSTLEQLYLALKKDSLSEDTYGLRTRLEKEALIKLLEVQAEQLRLAVQNVVQSDTI